MKESMIVIYYGLMGLYTLETKIASLSQLS